MTETQDKAGNTIQSYKDGPLRVDDMIPKDATEEQKEAAQGYFFGYLLTIKNPDGAEKFLEKFINPDYDEKEYPRTYRIGFLLGVQEAMKVRDLMRDTLEAIGVPLIPSTPQP